MTIIFSSQQIAELAEYSLKQKNEILSHAASKLSVPERFFLSLIKLFILIPPFLLLATIESWLFIIPVVLLFILYFLVMRPMKLWLLSKHIKAAVLNYENSQ